VIAFECAQSAGTSREAMSFSVNAVPLGRSALGTMTRTMRPLPRASTSSIWRSMKRLTPNADRPPSVNAASSSTTLRLIANFGNFIFSPSLASHGQ
jgi:hypothetical protein